MRYIKFEHSVIEARWNEEDSRWHLKIEDIKGGSVIEDECDVLLSATGILKYYLSPNHPAYADFCTASGNGQISKV